MAPTDPRGATIELLGVVWEAKPDDAVADWEPRGGIVVRADIDDNGERTITCLNTELGNGGRPRVVLQRLNASDIDGQTVVPPSTAAMCRAVRRICRDLGAPIDNAYLSRREVDMLNLALRLVAEDAHRDRKVS